VSSEHRGVCSPHPSYTPTLLSSITARMSLLMAAVLLPYLPVLAGLPQVDRARFGRCQREDVCGAATAQPGSSAPQWLLTQQTALPLSGPQFYHLKMLGLRLGAAHLSTPEVYPEYHRSHDLLSFFPGRLSTLH
jgi:hypothetical protein